MVNINQIIINNIIKQIININNKNNENNNIKNSDIFVLPTNYIPFDFINKLNASYLKYQNYNIKSDDIIEDIYIISLCGNILNDRRRLLYKDVTHIFLQNKSIFKDIKTYINQFPKSNILLCKKIIGNNEYLIHGELDLIDTTGNELIDFKCSNSTSIFKLEWFVQLLIYKSIYNDGNDINLLTIYNPLKGLTCSVDITEWTLNNNNSKILLEYMYYVRERQTNKKAVFTPLKI